MFYSQCFLSREGPLGSIWVAAYCYKKLKKSQVTHTDISSSVDKVLQDEFDDAVAYRVLAYFLLGIARIYSKKVDYLFNDCNKVLAKVKEFVAATGNSSDIALVALTSPCFGAITLPERFELDAFDLGILEDTGSGCNVLPLEEITLGDGTRRHGRSEYLAREKYHCMDLVPLEDRFPAAGFHLNEDMLAVERVAGTSSEPENLKATFEPDDTPHQDWCEHSVEREMLTSRIPEDHLPEVGTSHSQVCQPEDIGESNIICMQKVWDDDYFEALSLNIGMSLGIEIKRGDVVELAAELHQTEGKHSDVSPVTEAQDGISQDNTLVYEMSSEVEVHCLDVPHIAKLVNEMNHGDVSVLETNVEQFQDNASLQGQSVDYEMFNAAEKPLEDAENVVSVETTPSRCVKQQFGLVYHRRAKKGKVPDEPEPTEASVEKLQDCRLSQEKVLNFEIFFPVQEQLECTTPCVKENHSAAERIKLIEEIPSANTQSWVARDACHLSVTVDSTPESQFPNTSGMNRTPEVLVIPTPAAKERAPTQRKRKCIFDDIIVFPNDIVKRSIQDPSDLVSKRRKVPHTGLAAWKAYRLLDLHQCLMEPLIPCSPLGTGSKIPFDKRSKIPEAIKTCTTPKESLSRSKCSAGQSSTVKPSGNSGSLNDGIPVEVVETQHSLEDSRHLAVGELVVDPPAKLDDNEPENDTVGISDQTVISPETPLRSSAQPMKLNIPESGNDSMEHTVIAPETPVQCTTAFRSFESPERPDACNTDFIGPSFSHFEEETDSRKDQETDFHYMNKDIMIEDEDHEIDGWSERTRVATRLLQSTFIEKQRKGEEEVVNLLQLLEGRTKKESVRLFYEILVLKCKGLVDVKQESGYGEILVQKPSSMES
ncbi:unnamed protein product [Linum tenue]|uniref:Sister chromatid cohesion 1 protein 2 n=2 Tax=Linum tenue TaxID=586396 RepID=A0AAV0NEL9_9ROSI|nr:unnamed protein product [Linum tenue]